MTLPYKITSSIKELISRLLILSFFRVLKAPVPPIESSILLESQNNKSLKMYFEIKVYKK